DGERRRDGSLRRCGKPDPSEAGALETVAHARVPAHHAPDEAAAIVLDHAKERALVDAQIVVIDPSDTGDATSMAQCHVREREAWIERIEEAVRPVDVLAEPMIHVEHGRNRELRRERN